MRDLIWVKTSGPKMIAISIDYFKGRGALMNAYAGSNRGTSMSVEFSVFGKSYSRKLADMARDNKKRIDTFRLEASHSISKKEGIAWDLACQLAGDMGCTPIDLDAE